MKYGNCPHIVVIRANIGIEDDFDWQMRFFNVLGRATPKKPDCHPKEKECTIHIVFLL
jgi:hypothetical protein